MPQSKASWKSYEEQTAELFRKLDCRVDIGAAVKGARARHNIDVWVRFSRFGIEQKWVVDCKFWRRRVTKEKVLALKAVVDDVGADRGILVSQNGFQAGAIRTSEHTNVTLTSLADLKQTAQQDLLQSAFRLLETKAIELKYKRHDLFRTERTGPQSLRSTPLPGVDGRAVSRATGKLAVLAFGFEQVRLGRSPYLIEFDDSENRIVVATFEEFIAHAAIVIADAERTLKANKPNTNI
jgi:Restriction endonuclease